MHCESAPVSAGSELFTSRLLRQTLHRLAGLVRQWISLEEWIAARRSRSRGRELVEVLFALFFCFIKRVRPHVSCDPDSSPLTQAPPPSPPRALLRIRRTPKNKTAALSVARLMVAAGPALSPVNAGIEPSPPISTRDSRDRFQLTKDNWRVPEFAGTQQHGFALSSGRPAVNCLLVRPLASCKPQMLVVTSNTRVDFHDRESRA